MQRLTAPVPHSPERQAERIRDIPRSCPCTYLWDRQGGRWRRFVIMPGCPWHYHSERSL